MMWFMDTAKSLERHQVWFYLIAIVVGMAVGWMSPEKTQSWELLLWPVLGVLLYTTFTQVPLTHVSSALGDRSFLSALLAGNFVLIPLVIGALLLLLPDDPAIRLGVLLVLLVPCTDWFISFTHLGGGDNARAVAAAPILLIAQLILLPVYLWLFMGDLAVQLAVGSYLLPAFFGLIVLPLILAALTQWLSDGHAKASALIGVLGWLPVPLLTVVVFLIAGSQVRLVSDIGNFFWPVLLVFIFYLISAAVIGTGLSRFFGFGAPVGLTLTFSFGTRNSFVMLPLALSLPEAWHLAVVVIVLQSLVELFGMIIYLRWLPQLIRSPD